MAASLPAPGKTGLRSPVESGRVLGSRENGLGTRQAMSYGGGMGTIRVSARQGGEHAFPQSRDAWNRVILEGMRPG